MDPLFKPTAPAAKRGFIGRDGQYGIAAHYSLDILTAIPFIWNQNIRKFMMHPATMETAQPADD